MNSKHLFRYIMHKLINLDYHLKKELRNPTYKPAELPLQPSQQPPIEIQSLIYQYLLIPKNLRKAKNLII